MDIDKQLRKRKIGGMRKVEADRGVGMKGGRRQFKKSICLGVLMPFHIHRQIKSTGPKNKIKL